MSGRRKEVIATGEIYHIFNKSVADEEIFKDNRVLNRLLELIDFYRFPQKLRYSFFKRLRVDVRQDFIRDYRNTKSFVTLYAFAFMPNHFHILLRQNKDRGIERFIGNLQNSFSKYHNIKNKRMGSTFLSPFKARHIDTDDEFLHVSRYIHLNPATSYLMEFEELEESSRTSFPFYVREAGEITSPVDTDFLLKIIGSSARYTQFVGNQVDYQRKLKLIKHLTFD